MVGGPRRRERGRVTARPQSHFWTFDASGRIRPDGDMLRAAKDIQQSINLVRHGNHVVYGELAYRYTIERALAFFRRMRTIRRIQLNRDRNEACDLGGEA